MISVLWTKYIFRNTALSALNMYVVFDIVSENIFLCLPLLAQSTFLLPVEMIVKETRKK
jgi:hypothetical protein